MAITDLLADILRQTAVQVKIDAAGCQPARASRQEIEARLTARVFSAVHHPERGPAVRAVLEQLLAVLDATRAEG